MDYGHRYEYTVDLWELAYEYTPDLWGQAYGDILALVYSWLLINYEDHALSGPYLEHLFV